MIVCAFMLHTAFISACFSVIYIVCHNLPSPTALDLHQNCFTNVITALLIKSLRLNSDLLKQYPSCSLSRFLTLAFAILVTFSSLFLFFFPEIFSPILDLPQLAEFLTCVLLTACLSLARFIMLLLVT
jgi:hypothetical protein